MMSLNSLYLDAFYACAQLQSFTKAAERLHVTQSALSQRIKNLELELETTLLIRNKKELLLTEFGEKLIHYCRSKDLMESDLKSMLGKNSGLSGVIRVGAFSSVARSKVLPALTNVLKANPEVSLRLVVREMYELMALLKSGEIDFLITIDKTKGRGLVSQCLGSEKNVLVQGKDYRGGNIFLDHDEKDQTTFDYFGSKLPTPFERRYLDDVYGIIDGVRHGLGKAIVPHHLIRDLKDIEIVNPEKASKISVWLYFHQQPFYSGLHKEVSKALSAIVIS